MKYYTTKKVIWITTTQEKCFSRLDRGGGHPKKSGGNERNSCFVN